MSDSGRGDRAVERSEVERMLGELEAAAWGEEGRVSALVETPEPHRHAVRERVEVVAGKGFAGDHARKSYYRGAYVPGREVSAITAEVLHVVGTEPAVVGDNLVTRGIDLARLQPGDLVRAGDVLLERSPHDHRPCVTFRNRTSPEAFAVVSRKGYRGALFVVLEGGVLSQGDPVGVVSAECRKRS